MPGVLMDFCIPVIAKWWPIAAWNTAWPYLLMLAGFSLIIFVHELGHFLVAKWAGVRVERFAIGFGRELFGVTRGETRYSFNILPLGGYVKMLGQEDFDDKANELRFKDDPRSFANKSVGRRMAIVSAGVVMNILFACLLFMIVFLVGMDAVAPRIALVQPDSPADKAGLLPGDIIREINGERVLEFNEIRFAVMLSSPHEPINFVVERGGLLQTFSIEPEYRKPKGTRDFQRQVVGITPGYTRQIVAVGPEIDSADPGQPQVGDILVSVGDIEVTDENASEVFNLLPYAAGDIYIEREDPADGAGAPQRVHVEIPPLLSLYPSDPRDPRTVSVLGLTPLVRFFVVEPRGRAYYAGIEGGDTVLNWDDRPHPNQSDIARAVRENPERDIQFRVLKADGRTLEGFIRPERHKRGQATIQALCESIDKTANTEQEGVPVARFAGVRPGGIAAEAGIESGDVILGIEGEDNPTCRTVRSRIWSNAGKHLALLVRKADGRTIDTLVQPIAPGSIDAMYTLVADDLLRIGAVVPEINGRPSPAAEAGIPPGSLILSVNGREVSTWRGLIQAFRANAGTTVELAFVDVGGNRSSRPFTVPHSIRTLLGVGPEARITRIDGRETIKTEEPDGGERLSVNYHEGTRLILSELAGRTQVPVEYREDPLAELKTAYIDVSTDMVDPWLGRVKLSPNILVGDERTLLKGENVFDAVLIGLHKTWYFIRQVYRTMERMIFTRTVGVESMSGPLGIIDIGGAMARMGIVKFLFFMAIISANLAVINFLPLPIVDGGLMVFLFIEKIKGSPVSLRVQIATQMIGLFLIIGAFLFITYQDALRMWG